MTMHDLVELAERVAEEAHRGQYRRDNITPYINHPRAVAQRVGDEPELKAVAFLHDVIEDSHHTDASLIQLGLPVKIVSSVSILTKKQGQTYEEYLSLVASDPIAARVKIADMITNLADNPTEKQIIKYAKGLLFLVDEGRKNNTT